MFCWPRSLSSVVGNAFSVRHKNDSTDVEIKTPPDHFGFLIPLSLQAKKGVLVLVGVIDPDYQGKLDHHSTVEVRKSAGNTLWCLLVLPYLVIKVNGELQHNSGKMTNGPYPLGMRM